MGFLMTRKMLRNTEVDANVSHSTNNQCAILQLKWSEDQGYRASRKFKKMKSILRMYLLMSGGLDENHSAGSEIQRPQYGRRSRLGSEPSTLETDVYVRRYALLVVLARNDDDDDDDDDTTT